MEIRWSYDCYIESVSGCWINQLLEGELFLDMMNLSEGINTVMCRYKLVNFLLNPHKIHPIGWPVTVKYGVFSGFKLWFILCLSHGSNVCDIMLQLNDTLMDIHSVNKDTWLIFIAWKNTIPGCLLFLSFGGFYASGSTETLVEVSKHKYNVQTTIKVALVIHFCFSC